jgi:hypothetical protein
VAKDGGVVDIFKIFPLLLLDLISKIVPGSLFLLVFRNRYLPLSEMALRLLEPPPLSAEWRSWTSIFMIVAASYVVGIFIALAANALDACLIRRRWFRVFSQAPDEYFFQDSRPSAFEAGLASNTSFLLFIDHCRSYVDVNSAASAMRLEKYRTAYRLFFGLTVLFVVTPLEIQGRETLASLLLAPVFAWLTYFMQRRYVLRSIQSFAMVETLAKSKAAAKESGDAGSSH